MANPRSFQSWLWDARKSGPPVSVVFGWAVGEREFNRKLLTYRNAQNHLDRHQAPYAVAEAFPEVWQRYIDYRAEFMRPKRLGRPRKEAAE